MTNTNTFSDSQESALINEEEYNEIQYDFGGTLPIPENINEDVPLLFDNQQIKQNESNFENYYASTSFTPHDKFAAHLKVEEEADKYYSLPHNGLIPHDDNDSFIPLNFQYSFGDGGTNQDWVYSKSLDKVFIKMEKILPMRFTWDPPMAGLYLRTAMVFQLEQYKSDPVKRCHNHMASTNSINYNIGPEKIKHVVHCVNHASIYEETNEFLSILTPLCKPEAGSQYVPMCFRFLCKNSCPSGMNRRPTELIFTLEDKNSILGCRKLLIRVCSCPKRDSQKEEREIAIKSSVPMKKRKLNNAMPLTKKMPSSSDTHVYKVELTIMGKENYLSVLKHAHDVMAGQAIRTGQYEFFKPYMDNIMHKMP